jgi:hypothetical protein
MLNRWAGFDPEQKPPVRRSIRDNLPLPDHLVGAQKCGKAVRRR